jgi:hypothetical protein
MPDGTLECAYHGLRYDMTGKCVMIPSHPTGPISPQAVVRPFPVIEQDGIVWVWPGDPARSETRRPPRLPEIGDEDLETVVVGPMEVPANYLLLIENLLDITHFYPLHDGNIGDVANSRIPVELEEGEVDGNRYAMTIRRTSNYTQPPYLVDWFHYDVVDRHHTHCMMSPAITRVVMRNAPPGSSIPAKSSVNIRAPCGKGRRAGLRSRSHPHADRRTPTRLASCGELPGASHVQRRSEEVGGKARGRNVSSCRGGGSVGARATTDDVRLSGRRLSGSFSQARHRDQARAQDFPGPRARGAAASLVQAAE